VWHGQGCTVACGKRQVKVFLAPFTECPSSQQALDQGEATRLLNKIKDSARRDSKKVKYERVVRAVQATAAQAIEQLFRLESLLPPSDLKTVRKLILDWMLPAVRASVTLC
jgi:hypothetical protein